MLSKTLAWKYVLPLLLVVSVAGGVVGGSAAYFLTRDEGADSFVYYITQDNSVSSEPNGDGLARGGIVHLGPAESLYGNPFCIEAQHFCIVQLSDGQILALYTYDTHPLFRSQDCAVHWLPDLSFEDPDTGQETQGWFRADCSGSTFRLDGERVFGPSSRDLDQFKATVLGLDGPLSGYIEVDTTHLLCGEDHGGGNAACDFAPLPQ
jgi:hypothetical protein